MSSINHHIATASTCRRSAHSAQSPAAVIVVSPRRTGVPPTPLVIRCLAAVCLWAWVPQVAAQDIAPLQLWGDLSQGGLMVGRATSGTELRLGNRRLRLSERGLFTFGFGRDALPSALLEWRLPSGVSGSRQLAVAAKTFPSQSITGVPQHTVTPSTAALARIRAESTELRRARSPDSAADDFFQGFVWPLIGPITGVYGSRRVYNGVPGRPHYGVDIAAPIGTPVHAPAAGIVRLAHPDMYYSGGTVILDHGHGVTSSFLHLSKILVQRGQHLRRGELLAEVGAGGRATGAHLDWRINWFGKRLDPARLAGPMPHE